MTLKECVWKASFTDTAGTKPRDKMWADVPCLVIDMYERLQGTDARIFVKPIRIIDCTKQMTTSIINELKYLKATGRCEWTSLSIAPKSALHGGFSFM
jgi:hypothetical protein